MDVDCTVHLRRSRENSLTKPKCKINQTKTCRKKHDGELSFQRFYDILQVPGSQALGIKRNPNCDLKITHS